MEEGWVGDPVLLPERRFFTFRRELVGRREVAQKARQRLQTVKLLPLGRGHLDEGREDCHTSEEVWSLGCCEKLESASQ